MAVRVLVRSGRYYDSVTLMALSQRLRAVSGMAKAAVVMGTPMNKEQLAAAGLLTDAAAGAGADDLVIAVGADTEAALAAAVAEAERALVGGVGGDRAPDSRHPAPRTIDGARRAGFAADLAMISVPGEYAAREARLALEQGLDVMLFSNNVALTDEVALKRLALAGGRLLMGPDCGTAILDGAGLGFANQVRRGPIGIVAASGTGAQELSCLIDRLGSGVSQLIGVGGRDLSDAVGGLMTLEAIRRLQADPQTRVIVVISKPPGHTVAEQVAAALEAPDAKPYVLCLLGGRGAPSLDEAAVKAVAQVTGEEEARLTVRLRYGGGKATGHEVLALRPGRERAYGLFSGGTLCSQAALVLGARAALIDLGEERYTVGRPHPMIDPSHRVDLLHELAADPQTGLFLLDVVLGHGAHPDPAGALAPAVQAAVDRGIAVVASVTGTEADPQCRSAQEAALQAAGAAVPPTARLAALVAKEVLA